MLFKELNRVHEIDAKITDLHQSLRALYDERANLLQPEVNFMISKKQAVALPKPSKDELFESYNSLQAIWMDVAPNFPSFKALQKRLEKACAIAAQLQATNPDLQGRVSIVAVPPFKIIENILASLSVAPSSRFNFDGIEQFETATKTKNWSLVVIVDPEFSMKIYGLQSFLEDSRFLYDNYDCRGLGIQELIAAELQGTQTVTEDGWTVLLKDGVDTDGVTCATLDNGQIVFNKEDTDCLLGENYLRLAIAAS